MSGNNGCQNDENDYEIGLRDGRLAALEEAALLAEADGVESVAARIRDLKLPRRPRVENKRACNPNLDSALMYARKEVREWAARDDRLTTDERAMKARASAHLRKLESRRPRGCTRCGDTGSIGVKFLAGIAVAEECPDCRDELLDTSDGCTPGT